MKRITIFLVMCSALTISGTTFADPGPPDLKQQLQAEVAQMKYDVSELNYFHVENFDYTQPTAILTVTPASARKRVVSHNRKVNRWLKQKYGRSYTDEDKEPITLKDTPIDPGLEIERPVWQWLASNVKDQT
jgi:hypothetical protein